MSSTKRTDRFVKNIDFLLEYGKVPSQRVEEDTDLLQLAGKLAVLDPSQESRTRLPLRSRLWGKASQELPAKSSPSRFTPRMGTIISWGIGAAALIALVLGLSWVFANLVPSSSVEPLAGESTSSPIPTDVFPTATPLPLLGMETPLEEIIGRMSSSLWLSVWVDGSVTTVNPDGQNETVYTQAWLDRSGRGRVLSSDTNPGLPESPLEIPPRWVWISDGQKLAKYDVVLGNYDPTSGLFGWAEHPLENAGQFTQLIFPYYIAGRGGFFKPVNEEIFAGRPALVVDWSPDVNSPVQDRFWVDQETGFLLRRTRMLEDGTLVEDAQVRSVVYDLPFPDSLAGVGGLNAVRFTSNPQDVAVPAVFEPLPTPVQPLEPTVPVVNVDSSLLLLDMVSDPVYTGEPGVGDLYVSNRVFGEEISSLLRVDDVCLFSQAGNCPVVPVEYPTLAWSPLFWSPDGSQAAFLDSNNARLILYDAQTREWRMLVDPFYATSQVLYWSADGAWMAVTLEDGQDSNNSLLTLVSADGSVSRQVAPDLAGMQVPVGWLDGNRLLFTRYRDVPKGQVGIREEPLLYEFDLSSGVWSQTLPDNPGMYPVLSPERSKLAFMVNEDGVDKIAVYEFSTGETTHTLITGMNPVWSPDGQRMAVVRMVDGVYEVYLVRWDNSQEQKIFEWAGYPVVTWSLDGRHLVIEASPAGDQPSAPLFLVSNQEGVVREIVLDMDPGMYELRYPSFRP